MSKSGSVKSSAESPVAPPSLRRDNTMLITSKEGLAIIQDEVLDSSRSGSRNVQQALSASTKTSTAERKTTKNSLPQLKRDSTISTTVKEAKLLYGRGTGSSSSSRLRVDKKKQKSLPKIRRDNTMKKTVQDGIEYVERMTRKTGTE